MKTILVPVGSSKNAKSHLQYAVDFAKDLNARLLVVQVYNVYTKAGTMIKIDTILERESLSFLKRHIAEIDSKGVEIMAKTFKGKLVDTIEFVCEKFSVDLIVLEPRTNSIKDEVFLGKTSGKIIKQTQIPALIVPEGYVYKPMNSILMTLKSATIKKVEALEPLKMFKTNFNATINLLLVKTPRYNKGDFDVSNELDSLVSATATSENATTYQGFLEHYKEYNSNLLCVVRRKRGFFKKLWEKNVVLKKDLHVTKFPVLVLSGLK
jgi:nucleotide-binding universal stress UspA family protein